MLQKQWYTIKFSRLW